MYSTESEIILDFLKGSDEAYTLLYEKYIDDLFSYGKAITSDVEQVKDAIQDVFYKILSNRKLLQNVQNLKCFLFISLKNRIIDMNRKATTISSEDLSISNFTVTNLTILDDLIEEEDRKEICERVKKLLNELTSRQREAVCLRYIYNMKYGEIADILNMQNEKSARNLVSRAIEKLRSENPSIILLLQLLHFGL
jgi:RNA polymerase sigma factor (sigma-70 family)